MDSAWANYVFVHEFGHQFAGLADEYYTSPVAYAPAPDRPEPWESNVTALARSAGVAPAMRTPGANAATATVREQSSLKWSDLVLPDTPIPTPWDKETFESYSREIQKRRAQLRKEKRPEAEMEALFSEELEHERAMFAREKYARAVGAFEGALYESRGYYRPQVDCIMFSRTDHFCAVCRRAIERIIDLYSRRS